MKKYAFLTTSLCAVLGASLCFGGAAAFAETDDGALDHYPDTFLKEITFENADDYAVGDGKLAVLQGTTIYEYSDDVKTTLGCENKTVKSVWYANDGALCYGNDNGVFYYETDEKADITVETAFFVNGYGYQTDPETGFVVVTGKAPDYESSTLNGHTRLKKCNDKAYALNDGALYELVGKDPHKVTFTYLDDTLKILIGNARDVLATTVDRPAFVSLKQGAFLTEVDIDGEDGDCFKTGETLKVGAGVNASTALLLAKTGANDGVSIIMVSDGAKSKCYLLRTVDADAVTRSGALTEMSKSATVTVADGFVYTRPFVCASTHLKDNGTEYKIKSGDALKVVGEVTKTNNPELLRDFYKVELTTSDGATPVYGYVPTGYVSLFTYVEPPEVETPDPDYSDENLIRPVILILLVVILVLTAGAYVIYVFSSGKTKKKKDK